MLHRYITKVEMQVKYRKDVHLLKQGKNKLKYINEASKQDF